MSERGAVPPTPVDAAAALRPIAGAILWNPDGTVLLQHRDDDPGIQDPGRWSLFGGGIEAGETPERAMLRELDEELGVRPALYQPFVVLRSARAEYHLFLARLELPLERLELREGQGFAYLEPADALATSDLTASARAALRMLQAYAAFRAALGLSSLLE